MVSVMAMEDCERLAAEGVKLTPRDIVRLNGLGLKVERSTEGGHAGTLPRAAILGGIVFREPSVAAEMWLQDAARFFDTDNADTLLQLRAYSLARPPDALPDFTHPKEVALEVRRFVKKELGRFTVRQIGAALSYALFGNDPAAGERPPPREGKPAADGTDGEDVSYEAGLLRDGLALKIGTPDTLKNLRVSDLEGAILCALDLTYGSVAKDRRAVKMAEYFATLDEIKKRSAADGHEDERTLGEAVEELHGIVENAPGDERKEDE